MTRARDRAFRINYLLNMATSVPDTDLGRQQGRGCKYDEHQEMISTKANAYRYSMTGVTR